MQLTLNGKPYHYEGENSVAALIEQSGLAGKRIAVELNESIIPKSRHAETGLKDGDRIEIIHAIGGG